ncbi:MAG: DegV family protein [Clostridia bacterium]|nr:DegV family protein [Clostridia bacterium]
MRNFYITTDSGCDISYEMCKKFDIVPLFMEYIIDGTAHTDVMDDNKTREFYDSMRAGVSPMTTQINVPAFLEFWEPMLADNIPILHISLGSGISGTYNNAVEAAKTLEQSHPGTKIIVIDSTAASLGYGMMAIIVSQMRENGASVDECAAWLIDNRHKMNVFFTTSTLTYLHRGGRVSKTKAVLGTMLNIHPILHLNYDGCLRVFDSARGDSATLKRVIDNIGKTVISPETQTLYISHSDTLDKAKEFGEAVRKKYGFKDVCYTYIGSIIGTHTGPGLVAIFYFGGDRPVTE